MNLMKKKVEDWNSNGIETIETPDSITFKSIHLSRIGGGRKRSLEASKSTVSSIKIDETNGAPLKFELYQNYPNPFNPTTIIKYSINKTSNSNSTVSYVNLRVYDVLGEEVKTLVNQNQVPGIYEVNFDASSLTSGIYYYRLQYGNFIQTKKNDGY
ncbi:MAG: T9SS type A sorting domain-containing protein [Ignavibacteriales bacterium]|nr:T9SS type A sorting domain-containing protein [Ignavibacteriales bacterium]